MNRFASWRFFASKKEKDSRTHELENPRIPDHLHAKQRDDTQPTGDRDVLAVEAVEKHRQVVVGLALGELDPGDPLAARRIFINDGTNGTPIMPTKSNTRDSFSGWLLGGL